MLFIYAGDRELTGPADAVAQAATAAIFLAGLYVFADDVSSSYDRDKTAAQRHILLVTLLSLPGQAIYLYLRHSRSVSPRK